MKSFIIFAYRLIEYFDKALYTLALPFIAPLFFPSQDPAIALMWGYMLIPITTLSRPLGAFFFGKMSFFSDHTRAFHTAALGLGISTLLIGFLPTYASIGLMAPFLLGCLRFLQNFFISGQTTGGALILMEKTAEKSKSFFSSCYESVAEIGALVAAQSLALLAYFGDVNTQWRFLFILGSSIGLLAFFSKGHLPSAKSSGPFLLKNSLMPKKAGAPSSHASKSYSHAFFSELKNYKKRFFIACLFAGFGYGNYALISALFIGLVPLISPISKAAMMQLSSCILILDIALLPLFGKLCDYFGKDKVTIVASFALAIFAAPLITLLEGGSFAVVAGVYTALITLCVAIVAPFYHWMTELAPEKISYTFISLAKAVGLQLIGAPIAAAAFVLYHLTHSLLAPGLLLSLMAFSVAWGVLQLSRKSKKSLKKVS